MLVNVKMIKKKKPNTPKKNNKMPSVHLTSWVWLNYQQSLIIPARCFFRIFGTVPISSVSFHPCGGLWNEKAQLKTDKYQIS
jgi:hypothetical protein